MVKKYARIVFEEELDEKENPIKALEKLKQCIRGWMKAANKIPSEAMEDIEIVSAPYLKR